MVAELCAFLLALCRRHEQGPDVILGCERQEDLELVQRERAAEKAEGCADKDRAQRTAQEELDRWHEAEVRAGRGSQAELEVRRRERETAAERDARARGGQALGP